ncbi:FAD-dependent oxidoreductase [Neolewinella persica]|uniref:FAD-dependent oxidoreductase n=1 Tax=Neolewinella persica TaxID=70998 RepID=UPI00035EA6D2|nr:FAD-dependent oxidoreductase [Neolewinella persica]
MTLRQPDHYDIAILGGGLAGLSTLYHLERAGKLVGKRVVLVDPEGKKTAHDRSWSFWEAEPGPFEELVHHQWPLVTVHDGTRNLDCDISPYIYKLIRSTEFYAHVNKVIDQIEGLERLDARAEEVRAEGNTVRFKVNGEEMEADLAFSSLPLHLRPRQISAPYLDQHFRGWFIETKEDTFDPGRAALMDFRTPQHGEPRFFYVMPFSKRSALIEIAIFSNNHLETAEYDRLIETYIYDHWTKGGYEVTHAEDGNIPMTTYPFPLRDRNLIYIGMRGGATRPSTGYTFYALQRQLTDLADQFPNLDNLAPWPRKHLLYDATLLRILQNGELPGDELFVDMFAANPPARVLAFLNGETSFGQELKFMSTTKVSLFARRFIGELYKTLRTSS